MSQSTATEDQDLDFSSETPKGDEQHTGLQLKDYDPRPQEDQARRNIAYLLIGLLWLVIAGILILLAFGTIEIIDIKEFAVIVGPVVTLVSVATGFYYGTKSNIKHT